MFARLFASEVLIMEEGEGLLDRRAVERLALWYLIKRLWLRHRAGAAFDVRLYAGAQTAARLA